MRASLQLTLRFLYDADGYRLAYIDYAIYSDYKVLSYFYKNRYKIVTYGYYTYAAYWKWYPVMGGFLQVFSGIEVAAEADYGKDFFLSQK